MIDRSRHNIPHHLVSTEVVGGFPISARPTQWGCLLSRRGLPLCRGVVSGPPVASVALAPVTSGGWTSGSTCLSVSIVGSDSTGVSLPRPPQSGCRISARGRMWSMCHRHAQPSSSTTQYDLGPVWSCTIPMSQGGPFLKFLMYTFSLLPAVRLGLVSSLVCFLVLGQTVLYQDG